MARQPSGLGFRPTHGGRQFVTLDVPRQNLIQNIHFMNDHIMRQIEARARRFAADVERDMRSRHDFDDQPPDIHKPYRYPNDHARRQLYATAYRHHGDRRKIVVEMGHSKKTFMQTKGQRSDARHGPRKVTYGGILETGKFWKHDAGDRYATVRKTYRGRKEEFHRLGQGVVKSFRGAVKEKAKGVLRRGRGR
jgi:hypothetical protein